ncbi:MAG: hypothetical protein ACYC1Z_06170, partial [Georgenia sp.]
MSSAQPSRRHALRLGALGLAGIAVGAGGLSRTGLPWSPPPTGAGGPGVGGPGAGGPGGAALVEPEVLSSEAGLLRVELVAARTEVELAGRQARVLT